jgi:hypothetical protein
VQVERIGHQRIERVGWNAYDIAARDFLDGAVNRLRVRVMNIYFD